MKILITNDDGINATGILALARAMSERGHDVTILAPSAQQSGTAAGIGGELQGRFIGARRIEMAERVAARAWAIDAPPATAVLASALGFLDLDPDVVLSGTNLGFNFGRLSVHSGTIGAAMTAATYGVKAIAVSCSATGEFVDEAAAFVGDHLESLLSSLDDGEILSINYPDVPLVQIAGIAQADPTAPEPGDARLEVVDGGFAIYLERATEGLAESADARLVRDGYVSIAHLRAGMVPAARRTIA